MPQPVDFGTEVAKMSAAERVMDVTSRLSLAAQQRHAVEEKDSAHQKETQINQTANSENPGVDPDGENKEGQRDHRRRPGAQAGQNEPRERNRPPAAAAMGEGGHLDVSI